MTFIAHPVNRKRCKPSPIWRRFGVLGDMNLSAAVWQAAGTLKANLRRISLADCFAIELAERLSATVLTADHHEFDVLAVQTGYRVKFIR